MTAQRVALLVKDNRGNMCGIVFNSFARLDTVRDVIENKGIETYGAVSIVTLPEVLLSGDFR